ncbi:MAG: hypothetical protein ACKOC5_05335 [Chloroflexota bacterium]
MPQKFFIKAICLANLIFILPALRSGALFGAVVRPAAAGPALGAGALAAPGSLSAPAQASGGAALPLPLAAHWTAPQDFSQTPAPQSGCITDTTQADFQAGAAAGCDLGASPGSVSLVYDTPLDQSMTNTDGGAYGLDTVNIEGQTFTPAVSGLLAGVDLYLLCGSCSGVGPDVVIEIRAASGGLPSGAALASAVIPGFGAGAPAYHSAVFASPPSLTAGTVYAITARAAAASSSTHYYWDSGSSNLYPGGGLIYSSNGGADWGATGSQDHAFKTYRLSSDYVTSGSFISASKDANPAAGKQARWTTLSWTAVTPANTSLKFQVAGSNNPGGPFNFTGPDGASETFYTTSGASLSPRFDGLRYLKWKAYLSSSDVLATPSLNDVTVCFDNPDIASVVLDPAAGVFGGAVTLTATLTANSAALSGKTVAFTLHGGSPLTAVTNASGVAVLSNLSLAGIDAGSYPGGVTAAYAGDSAYSAANTSISLAIAKADQTITFPALPNRLLSARDFTLTATASSGLPVAYTPAGPCTVSGSLVHLTGVGECTITAAQPGNTNYNLAPSLNRSFTIDAVLYLPVVIQ